MASIPAFDTSRYFLGNLCKRKHEWGDSGKSLRRISKHHCMECERFRQRPHYHRRAKEKFAKKIEYVQRIKLERGCADCGYNAHPAALHFDHLPGFKKVQGIAQMCNNTSMAKLRAEIAKCEVVCANCHAIRTAERRGQNGG